jgi:GWxTD domain-containing protein
VPDKPYYTIVVGRYLMASRSAITRASSHGFFEQALSIARKSGDSTMISDAAVELGRSHWRRYEDLANRRLELAPGGAMGAIHDAMQPVDPTAKTLVFDMKVVRAGLEAATQALPPNVTGEGDHKKAAELFREAYALAPTSDRAFRALARLMVDREQWQELDLMARQHVARIPWDAWAWLSAGLASHRLGNSKAAGIAFDSALTYLSTAERARLDNITRVLAPGDTSKIVRGTPGERAVLQRFFWVFADPLWSRTGNEARIEFLARVAYAELRWTVEDQRVKGADSDRGNIHVRYGPPPVSAAIGPDPSAVASEISWIWAYPTSRVFEFRGRPGFGTAITPSGDLDVVYRQTRDTPVRWDNLADIKIDSMPTQVARFRAPGDSVDVFFAAQAPVDSIRKSSDVGDLNSHVWLLSFAASTILHDSAALSPKGSVGWTRRLPAGGYIFRAEASTQGSTRAGRSTTTIDGSGSGMSGLPARGLGISDMLIATSAEPKGGAAKRWSDYAIEPTAGAISRSGQLTLVWENYEFGKKDDATQYTVTITLTRERSAAGQLAANILGALASVARVDRNSDKMTVSFDRNVPHAAAVADHISIGLGETPLGQYLLTLEVTDKVSGQKATRTARFIIRD